MKMRCGIILFYTVNPKYKNPDYALNLIRRQTEMVKGFINQSHILYLQPDMETNISINVEVNVREDNGEFYTYEMGDNTTIEWQTDHYNIQDALNELYQDAIDKIEYMYDNKNISIEWLHFS